MQPFQCDLQTQTQETHRTTYTGPSSVAKHIEGTKRPQPHPPHRQGTFHRRLQPLYTEKHKVSCSGFLSTTKPMQHSCSHSNAICKHKLKKRIELRTQDHPVLQKHIEGTKRPQPHPPHRTRYLSSSPAATLHGKTQGFVLRLPPHNKAHATFMQPFQCDLQTQTQETHRTTYAGTSSVAKHIEGTKRPQPHPPHGRGTFHRRLQPLYTEKHKVSCSGFLPNNKAHATFMQPFQCDLQTQTQETHRTTYTGTSSIAKHIEGTKRPQPHPPHRRGTFHRRLQPLYTEKTQGFVLRLPPHKKAHATFMQPFQCDLQTQTQETHRTTYTGTSSVAKHIEGTKRPQPHPPHRRGTFLSSPAAATLRGKTQGFVLRLPPQHKAHATSCSHSNAICHHSFKKQI